ncbi:AbiV family abortive infection protein [Amycolatopsis sp. DG1A-15b]|uniref:AbiV family abortive infection protein n=1 Tax=Amycolatopsis sp. DG1A-15b TaxID=3052846 RepID=UPI00255C2769|nr:AbiV family abortive infection protein [Amycolatopsis sp. DG1A-15b]WIX85680.1 AbiV family abortive infection protein [Amycolatopsis sp. DG1A-15b]
MVEMSPSAAREFWKALMDNASALVTDAHTLLAAGSYGRARSLSVLAQEELGKALWIYEDFSFSWNEGDDSPRVVDNLTQHGRDHTMKYLEAVVFGDELAEFWGDYSRVRELGASHDSWEEAYAQRQREAELAAREANAAKQQGFYVDRAKDGSVLSPTALPAGTTETDLQTAAQVIEMLLIRDHTRMKHDAKTPYDSTHEQQFRLLPVAHPEDWAAFQDARVREERHTGEAAAQVAEPSGPRPETPPDQAIDPAAES